MIEPTKYPLDGKRVEQITMAMSNAAAAMGAKEIEMFASIGCLILLYVKHTRNDKKVVLEDLVRFVYEQQVEFVRLPAERPS